MLPPPATAAADWVRMGETSDVVLHIDPGSSKRSDQIVLVRELQELKRPDPDGVLSRTYDNEYDCHTGMHRLSRMSSYSANGLSGRKLFDIADGGYWRKVPKDGLFRVVHTYLCKAVASR